MPDNSIEVKITGDASGVISASSTAGDSVQALADAMTAGFAQMATSSQESTAAIVEAMKGVEVEVEKESITIREQLGEAGKSLVEFAETAKLTSLSTASAFGAIGYILGGGLIVGALAEIINKTREHIIETNHQAEALGIAAGKLQQFKDVTAEYGVNQEKATTSLKFLEKAMSAASDGSHKQLQAFQDLNVSAEQITEHLNDPIGMFAVLAEGVKESGNASQRTADLLVLLGRQGTALTGVMHDGTDAFNEHMSAMKADGDALQAAIPSAQELTRVEAELGRELRTMAFEVFPPVVTGLKYVTSGFLLFKEVTFDIIQNSIAMGKTFGAVVEIADGLGKAIKGNMAVAEFEIKEAAHSAVAAWDDADKKMAASMAETDAKIKALFAKKPAPEEGGEGGEAHGHLKDSTKLQEAEIDGQKKHALAMLEIRKEFLEDEAKIIGGYDISKAQKLRDIADLELNITKDALRKKAALIESDDPDAPAKKQIILNEIQAAEDANSKRRLSITEADNEARKKSEEKLAEETLRMIEAVTNGLAKASAKRDEIALKSMEASVKLQDTQIQANQKHQDDLLDAERRRIELSAALGEISERQKIQMVQGTYDVQFAMSEASIQKEIILQQQLVDAIKAKRAELQQQEDNGGATAATQAELAHMISAYDASYQKLTQLHEKLTETIDKQNRQSETTQAQLLTQTGQTFNAFITGTGIAFQNGVMSWVKGTQTFKQAFAGMGANMLSSWVGTLVQMGVKWAERQALNLALHEATNLGIISSDTAAALVGKGVTVATGLSEITAAAGIAAANAFASTAAIPFVGLALAPAAAATALGSVMSFAPLVSAESGADLPNYNTIGMLHPREMVLPAGIADNIRSMSGNGGGSSMSIHGGVNVYPPSGQNVTPGMIVSALRDAQRMSVGM
jgi:hypothetical protein